MLQNQTFKTNVTTKSLSGVSNFLGWGLLSQFPPFRYFPKISALRKHTLAVEYHVYIRQVSPQLSSGDYDVTVTNSLYVSATRPHRSQLNIGSSNGLVSSGNKALSKPMSTQFWIAIWCHYATTSYVGCPQIMYWQKKVTVMIYDISLLVCWGFPTRFSVPTRLLWRDIANGIWWSIMEHRVIVIPITT